MTNLDSIYTFRGRHVRIYSSHKNRDSAVIATENAFADGDLSDYEWIDTAFFLGKWRILIRA